MGITNLSNYINSQNISDCPSRISLDFWYELGLLDLQKQGNDNTKNINRAFVVGWSYLKPLNK